MKLPLLLLLASTVSIGCTKTSDKPEFKACLSKAAAYFREIGSYPVLSDGRKADDVAKERCYNTTGAFAPIVGQESLLVLEAKDAKTHQATELNDNIEVVLWMPSMGHGSAPTQVERAVDSNGNILPGVFNVRNVYFIMGGDWEVRVTLTDAQGAQEMKSFKVTLDGGHDHGGHH